MQNITMKKMATLMVQMNVMEEQMNQMKSMLVEMMSQPEEQPKSIVM